MNIQDIIREMETQTTSKEAQDLNAAAEVERETQKFTRGQIRVVKRTNERVTIMAASDSEIDVIYNKTGRRKTLKKDETIDFVQETR